MGERDPGSVVVLAHPSPDLYGSDRMLVESVRALVPSRRVVVTLPADGPLSQVLRDAGAEVEILPVPVLRKAYMSPLGLVRLAAAALRALPRARRLLRRTGAEAVYVNTVTIPLWLVAARLARVPALCHVHEAEDGVPGPVRAALTAPLRLARTVVVNSRASAAALGAAGRRSEIIYNGVDEPPAVTEPRAVPTGPVRIVLVGRLSPRKGSDVAVRAAGLLRERGYDATLTLVGDVFPGYEWFEQELRELAGDALRDGSVVLAGFRSSVWDSFAEADVAIVPSRVEPFGNVAVEAMLAGRPVVAAASQGLVEIVADGENGVLVPADDPAALAGGIARLLDDWDGALAMAKRARADAARRFGKDRYHRELREAVRALTDPDAGTVRTSSTR
ncbi:glycosyltransferase family 4 protein [Actinomadura viridis]|uniref:Glycosyltransferase involved in cell wall biosynthesis n=1 Tax=Actinomadura viridis TaxID=58110 RepID=A0A931GP72_9ACTN|nr:glycosyltransferase family 4 protein [Actinomadura viridis]MBG6087109.1 glycosyltransferase involved in cell wall biosynthesis [Actinomadura viridis]